jgi:hypothetical protein
MSRARRRTQVGHDEADVVARVLVGLDRHLTLDHDAARSELRTVQQLEPCTLEASLPQKFECRVAHAARLSRGADGAPMPGLAYTASAARDEARGVHMLRSKADLTSLVADLKRRVEHLADVARGEGRGVLVARLRFILGTHATQGTPGRLRKSRSRTKSVKLNRRRARINAIRRRKGPRPRTS